MAGISILQLDTHFPRLPGDIACAETYQIDFEAVRVPDATVSSVVTDAPSKLDLSPYIDVARKATGDLISTSCGFLAPFQSEMERELGRPFVVSSLTHLPIFLQNRSAAEAAIFTFDVSRFSHTHLLNLNLAAVPLIFGLSPEHHLHEVITKDRSTLDLDRAQSEVLDIIDSNLPDGCKALFLECTNLPVYKNAIREKADVEIYDVLTEIEAELPGAVNTKFL